MRHDFGTHSKPSVLLVEFADSGATPSSIRVDTQRIERLRKHCGPDALHLGRADGAPATAHRTGHQTSGFTEVSLSDDKNLQDVISSIKAEFGDEVRTALPVPDAIPALGPEEFETQALLEQTPDFSQLQGYAGSAPVGLGFNEVASLEGADGRGITVVDLEGSWRLAHEALASVRFNVWTGTPNASSGWIEHGTAVSSILFSPRDGVGISGLVPAARGVLASIYTGTPLQQRISQQLWACLDFLQAGDVILVEVQRPGPKTDYQAHPNQTGYLPVSFWPDVRDAMKACVAKGIVVVEVGGNGGVNLDDAETADSFNQVGSTDTALAETDSGSIMVGAGAPPNDAARPARSRLPFSNHGQRLDCQAWGQGVVGAGYGDLWNAADTARSYTANFLGTSSAGPLVAAAVASIQGRYLRKYGQFVPPLVLRQLFASFGLPQAPDPDQVSTTRIGPQPDLPFFFRALNLL